LTDKTLENLIAIVLRSGVLAAASIVGISGVVFVAQHHAEHPAYASFHSEADNLRTIGGILRLSIHLQSAAIIQLGLLVLVATPVLRVALAAVGFYLERDRLYFVVSLVVLTILLLSLVRA
jgi:uncharacterized membrane protein